MNKKWKILRGALACQLCLLVFMTSVRAEMASRPAGEEASAPQVASEKESGATEGVAFYYTHRYYRKRTSSGARYDPRKLTAAHPSLPLGKRVKVVNLANERSVIVIVNDRCRKHRFEVIDLSQAAARRLGFFGKGRTRVRIIPLDGSP